MHRVLKERLGIWQDLEVVSDRLDFEILGTIFFGMILKGWSLRRRKIETLSTISLESRNREISVQTTEEQIDRGESYWPLLSLSLSSFALVHSTLPSSFNLDSVARTSAIFQSQRPGGRREPPAKRVRGTKKPVLFKSTKTSGEDADALD